MKKVIITGANSYVGTNVEKWLMKEPENFYVETLDMKDPNWKLFDFSRFDVVFHVAGIAHVSTKKSMKDLYYKINRDLAIETARISKSAGIKQFIFMSSMIVYNTKETKINKDTIPNPNNFYGLSKLEAEQSILKMQNELFCVSIIRPPLIYGPKSKGNFDKLIKVSKRFIILPDYQNNKSMIFIENFSNAVKLIINERIKGILFAQNTEIISTSELIEKILNLQGKRFIKTKYLNIFINLLTKVNSQINKIFGNFFYELDLTDNLSKCNVVSFDESIRKCIKND